MAHPLEIKIKESIKDLRSLQREQGELIGKRIQVLIEIKRHEKTGISKRDLSDLTGVNHNSIVKWRKMYLAGGIDSLLKHGRIGFKPSILSPSEHEQIRSILNNNNNNIRGYIELLEWVKKELGKELKYTTLVEYVKRNFATKIKVARKSHVKKDESLVASFKKTSGKNVKK
mgnify:CR=1 FL=1